MRAASITRAVCAHNHKRGKNDGRQSNILFEKTTKRSKIFDDYPNFFNRDLPTTVFCACPQNKTNATLAFRRCCPDGFKVYQVQYAVCEWTVDYILANGDDLPPPGSDLTKLFEKLTMFHPCDTKIKQKQLSTPKIATVVYEVKCDCKELGFENKVSVKNTELRHDLTEEVTNSLQTASINNN